MRRLGSPVMRHRGASHQRGSAIEHGNFTLLELVDHVVIRPVWSKLSVLVSVGLQDLLNVLLLLALGLHHAVLSLIDHVLVIHALVNLVLHL